MGNIGKPYAASCTPLWDFAHPFIATTEETLNCIKDEVIISPTTGTGYDVFVLSFL
jgi:hypothetical protein